MTKRSSHTRKAIVEALFKSMSQSDGAKPTVQEICTEAGISRRNFYRYFEGINDLLERGIDLYLLEFNRSLRDDRDQSPSTENPVSRLTTLLAIVSKHRVFFEAYLSQEGKNSAAHRLLHLGVQASKERAEKVNRTRDIDLYLSNGPILATLFYVIDHPDLKQSQLEDTAKETIAFIQKGLSIRIMKEFTQAPLKGVRNLL